MEVEEAWWYVWRFYTNKMDIIKHDKNHNAREYPEWWMFDNNYLYYMYCDASSKWWSIDLSLYSKAREYLYENISQIVHSSKRKDIVIPPYLYDDCNTEMFMIIDELYRDIFDDHWLYNIISIEWKESKWIRFEKYYMPQQVYWYIKLVVKNRIYTYLDNVRKENERESSYIITDYSSDVNMQTSIEPVKKKIACEQLVHIILSKLLWVSSIEKETFVNCKLKWIWFEEVSRSLRARWIDYSAYKVKKIVKKVLSEIKQQISDQDIDWVDIL